MLRDEAPHVVGDRHRHSGVRRAPVRRGRLWLGGYATTSTASPSIGPRVHRVDHVPAHGDRDGHCGTGREGVHSERCEQGRRVKATGKDALAFMRHWKDNSARLWCICTSGSSEVRMVGRAVGVRAIDHGHGVRGPHFPSRGLLRLSRFPGHPDSHPGIIQGRVCERVETASSKRRHGDLRRDTNRHLSGGPAALGGPPWLAIGRSHGRDGGAGGGGSCAGYTS